VECERTGHLAMWELAGGDGRYELGLLHSCRLHCSTLTVLQLQAA
jgi:hypothetical protein